MKWWSVNTGTMRFKNQEAKTLQTWFIIGAVGLQIVFSFLFIIIVTLGIKDGQKKGVFIFQRSQKIMLEE